MKWIQTWRYALRRRVYCQHQLELCQERHEFRLRRRMLANWRLETEHVMLLREQQFYLEDRFCRRRMHRLFSGWQGVIFQRTCQREQQAMTQATEFHNDQLAKKVMVSWKAYIEDRRLRSHEKGVAKRWVARRFFHGWQTRCTQHRHSDSRASEYHRVHLCIRSINQWSQQVSECRRHQQLAIQLHEDSLRSTVWTALRFYYQRTVRMRQLRSWFLMRKFLAKWHEYVQDCRDQRFLEQCRAEVEAEEHEKAMRHSSIHLNSSLENINRDITDAAFSFTPSLPFVSSLTATALDEEQMAAEFLQSESMKLNKDATNHPVPSSQQSLYAEIDQIERQLLQFQQRKQQYQLDKQVLDQLQQHLDACRTSNTPQSKSSLNQLDILARMISVQERVHAYELERSASKSKIAHLSNRLEWLLGHLSVND